MKQTCGKTTIEFDDQCGYSCNCFPDSGCSWIVGCPNGSGGLTYTSGTGFVIDPTHPPGSLTVAGSLAACALMLEKRWKRRVTVPRELRSKRLRRRTLQGTPEEMARALGLTLGPRR